MPQSLGLRRIVALGALLSFAPQAVAQERRTPRIPVRDSHGSKVGVRQEKDGRLLLSLANGTTFSAPRFQRWEASSDGRTLVGAGDPTMPEHPFEMQVAIYRDGVRVARLRDPLDPESSIVVSPDGRVAVIGHAPNERMQWFALALDKNGGEIFRHALPEGQQAKDPIFSADSVIVRTHELRREGRSGRILRMDVTGVTVVLEAAGAVELVGLRESPFCLLRSAGALTLFDARSGSVEWRREVSIRPAGRHAYAFIEAGVESAIAILHSDVQRRGQARPPVVLTLLGASDGTQLIEMKVVRRGPLADARLSVKGGQLQLEWNGTKEVIWSR